MPDCSDWEAQLAALPGRAGVYWKNLVTGEEFCHGADEAYAAASVIKLPVLCAVARREACEESGLTGLRALSEAPVSLEILTVNGHEKRGEYVPSHLHLNVTYLFEADDGLPLRVKPDENSGARWFAPAEAIAACTEPWMARRIYEKLNRRLTEYTK